MDGLDFMLSGAYVRLVEVIRYIHLLVPPIKVVRTCMERLRFWRVSNGLTGRVEDRSTVPKDAIDVNPPSSILSTIICPGIIFGILLCEV